MTIAAFAPDPVPFPLFSFFFFGLSPLSSAAESILSFVSLSSADSFGAEVSETVTLPSPVMTDSESGASSGSPPVSLSAGSCSESVSVSVFGSSIMIEGSSSSPSGFSPAASSAAAPAAAPSSMVSFSVSFILSSAVVSSVRVSFSRASSVLIG